MNHQDDPPNWSRRRFIGTASSATGALLLGVGCSDDESGAAVGNNDPPEDAGLPDAVEDAPNNGDTPTPEEVGAEDTTPDLPDFPPDAVPVSIIAVDNDIDAALARAVELSGGLDEIQPGDSVFIKTNAVHGFTNGQIGIVTSNNLLAAVVRLVKTRNPGRIIVGDRSARSFESDRVLELTGQDEAALEAGADEIYGAPRPADDPDAWVMVQPPGFEETWGEVGGILAMRAIVEADHFINLPVCKDHRWAVFSLSMKNLIGAIGDDSRDPMHYIRAMPDQLSRDIVTLNQAFSPLLNILDAQGVLLNGGPEGIGGDAVTSAPGLILASRDRIALDAAGVSLIQHGLSSAEVPEPDEAHAFLVGHSAWSCPQILHAINAGLGAAGASQVPLLFEGVDSDTAAAIEALFRA